MTFFFGFKWQNWMRLCDLISSISCRSRSELPAQRKLRLCPRKSAVNSVRSLCNRRILFMMNRPATLWFFSKVPSHQITPSPDGIRCVMNTVALVEPMAEANFLCRSAHKKKQQKTTTSKIIKIQAVIQAIQAIIELVRQFVRGPEVWMLLAMRADWVLLCRVMSVDKGGFIPGWALRQAQLGKCCSLRHWTLIIIRRAAGRVPCVHSGCPFFMCQFKTRWESQSECMLMFISSVKFGGWGVGAWGSLDTILGQITQTRVFLIASPL